MLGGYLLPTPAVSLVVPVHNRPDELRNLLAGLSHQTYDDFETVVVDDGSSPPVADVIQIEDYPFPLRVVRLDTCEGIGLARSRGVANAKGSLIVFADSDSIVRDPDWLRSHVNAHEDALRVVHGRVVGIHTTYTGSSDGYSNWFTSCSTKRRIITDCHVPTNNLSIPRQVFDIVGLFDESLAVLEDVDWAFRCLNKDIEVLYLPDAEIGHVDRESFAAFWRHYRQFGRAAMTVRRKNPRAPHSWLFPSGLISAWLLFLPLSSLMTLYITLQWLRYDPRVLFYVPGVFLGNVAYCWGIIESFRTDNDVSSQRPVGGAGS